MSLSDFFKKKPPALLTVRVNGAELCNFHDHELPSEKTPSIQVDANSKVSFVDSNGTVHDHALGSSRGWAHFSVRVHVNKACQADCVISDSPTFDRNAMANGKATGIRFQPFFLPEASVSSSELAGKGLFRRGLHFTGNVTPGNIFLSCECDECHRTFLIRSYHAGFSNSGYFYSASGKYTLTVSTMVPGSPAPLSTPDPQALAMLENSLPLAPDGSSYSYLNPFRCPHCGAPYINFEANPGLRENEYYGNYFAGSQLMQYEPAAPGKS
jgi:hypothetical protein